MITIGIDINDVLRAYTKTMRKYFEKEFSRVLIDEDVDWSTNEPAKMLPFPSELAHEKFLYEDYPYEIYGSCPTVEDGLGGKFNTWLKETLGSIENEDIHVIFVSRMEYELTIQATYFFLSKIGSRVREVLMPKNREEIWKRCDVLVTADPCLLDEKPEGKVSVKVEMPYNEGKEADFTYGSLAEFMENGENITKIIDGKKND